MSRFFINRPIVAIVISILTVIVDADSQLAGQAIEEIFERFPDLLAVAIIRGQQVQLPHGSTRVMGGDQLLVVATDVASRNAFNRLVSECKKREEHKPTTEA